MREKVCTYSAIMWRRLCCKAVQQPVISATLGHASPDSLDRYLSAEFKRLKECSLSIEHFPIGKGVG